MSSYSIVEYFADHDGYKCGYCKNKTTAYSQGMWAHSLNVEDYETLINRGWRRSGKYCYKPTMDKTCCPQYTIKCNAIEYKLSKSKKKVIKKMKNFLLNGGNKDLEDWKNYCQKRENNLSTIEATMDGINKTLLTTHTVNGKSLENSQPSDSMESTSTYCAPDKSAAQPQKGIGADPNKPKCQKAKHLRMERKREKNLAKGNTSSFENKINEHSPESNVSPFSLPHNSLYPISANHRLEIRLVQSSPCSPEFEASRQQSYSLYKKYQVAIHNDDENECGEKQWKRFLVDSPLNYSKDGPGQGYGSFHNQYWLDDKLIAVGVVDVLPTCLSSVYLYYDPDYGFLSLGIYSALSEIEIVRKLHLESNQFQYYYMGFYIHSCQKMIYKGKYKPSQLLCPETYKWVPIEKCVPELDKKKYAKLSLLNGGSPDDVDTDSCDVNDVASTRCLYQRSITSYQVYRLHKTQSLDSPDEALMTEEDKRVFEYSNFVGKTLSRRMLLYRQSFDTFE